jgi:hypothetical protein
MIKSCLNAGFFIILKNYKQKKRNDWGCHCVEKGMFFQTISKLTVERVKSDSLLNMNIIGRILI